MVEQISLQFPGTPEYLRLARLAVGDAGSRAALNVEELDDLRIAITELCALVGGGPTSTTALALTVDDRSVKVDGRADSVDGFGESVEFAEALIAAVVDEYEIVRDDDGTWFRMVKRATGLSS